MAMTFATNIVPDDDGTRSVGSSAKKFNINGHVAELIEVTLTASSAITATVSNANITADHVVLNDSAYIEKDVAWETAAGTISFSCSSGIPALTLYLGIK